MARPAWARLLPIYHDCKWCIREWELPGKGRGWLGQSRKSFRAGLRNTQQIGEAMRSGDWIRSFRRLVAGQSLCAVGRFPVCIAGAGSFRLPRQQLLEKEQIVFDIGPSRLADDRRLQFLTQAGF